MSVTIAKLLAAYRRESNDGAKYDFFAANAMPKAGWVWQVSSAL
jgi:hypothetical protein